MQRPVAGAARLVSALNRRLKIKCNKKFITDQAK